MTFAKYIVTAFLFMALLSGCSGEPTPQSAQIDISDIVSSNGVDINASTLVITRLSDNTRWISNAPRSKIQFSPASTSKIPHTLIALETQYAKPETGFQWDGTVRFAASWNQDQTLTSAFQRSAVWVYQDITSGLGRDVMENWLGKFEYGNANIGGPEDLTTYWLNGPLEISASGQIDFLTKLANGELPISEKTYQDSRQIMAVKRGKNWTLYAKTGWRHDGVNVDIGWYVGWLESSANGANEIYVFAFNMDLLDPKDRQKRKSTVHLALKSIGAIP